MTELYPCPACGFVVNDEPSGCYDICGICGWEDDPIQLSHPRLRGGANGNSLAEHQLEAVADNPLAMAETIGYKRDPEWRPLTDEEAAIRSDIPSDGLSYFKAAVDAAPQYYWRKKSTD